MKKFNIRVYGIIQFDSFILVSDEKFNGKTITKFIGGGLEYGEGLIDCLKREFIEELGIEIEILRHFYTTDFFVESLSNKNQQIISIYYLIKPKELKGKFSLNSQNSDQKLKWIDLNTTTDDSISLIIDKKVFNLLKGIEETKV
ncbi:MAG: NUDIX domain-containing protein [Bacteroidetes bacterium]|nr:NUDIX domain-containing protein [Bacteroidota bacterium]